MNGQPLNLENPRPEQASALSGHFFVPSYQRGYRWGRDEVHALLDDIYACGSLREGMKYCLQPIVIKHRVAGDCADEPGEGLPAAGQPYYELIDGQQRLTTLYLIYCHLRELKGVAPGFSLAYQTRPGSTGYLQQPTAERKFDNIDFFHMHQAYECIGEWFRQMAEASVDGNVMGVADDLYAYLRKRVYVIWYDAGAEDSIKLFTRLNVGRIPLTNAELVRALLLSGSNDGGDEPYWKIEIATQWDMIEQSLQDDRFWAFLTNHPASDYPSRIELIFDLLAKKRGERDKFFTFEYFRSKLARAKAAGTEGGNDGGGDKPAALAVWSPVLERYQLLREWFEHRDMYHKVGYLVASGCELRELLGEATGEGSTRHAAPVTPPTKSAFIERLDQRIRERLDLSAAQARELEYGKDKKCEQLLLLFNVESVRQLRHSSERYPFDSHKKQRWSLEHIHAQNAEPLKTEAEWRAWLHDAADALAAMPRLAGQDEEQAKHALIAEIGKALDAKEVERKEFQRLSLASSGFLTAEGGEEDRDSIANLALLSGRVNSALSNGAFQVKRLLLMRMDQEGEFIPLCTRRAFLKYYADADSQQPHLWSRADRDAYLDAMLGTQDSEGVVSKYLKKPAMENRA